MRGFEEENVKAPLHLAEIAKRAEREHLSFPVTKKTVPKDLTPKDLHARSPFIESSYL